MKKKNVEMNFSSFFLVLVIKSIDDGDGGDDDDVNVM